MGCRGMFTLDYVKFDFLESTVKEAKVLMGRRVEGTASTGAGPVRCECVNVAVRAGVITGPVADVSRGCNYPEWR